MTEEISYQTISNVLSCWEHANQKYSCREDIGNTILLELFEVEPETKFVFGFQPHQTNIEANPMLRMGLIVHGLRIVNMIDQILDLMGPDTDVLNEILQEQARRHQKHGVKKEHFAHMGTAIRGALSKILDGDVYTAEVDNSWKEMFDVLSTTIVQSY
jgi:hemoglobin-like flavoprotein